MFVVFESFGSGFSWFSSLFSLLSRRERDAAWRRVGRGVKAACVARVKLRTTAMVVAPLARGTPPEGTPSGRHFTQGWTSPRPRANMSVAQTNTGPRKVTGTVAR